MRATVAGELQNCDQVAHGVQPGTHSSDGRVSLNIFQDKAGKNKIDRCEINFSFLNVTDDQFKLLESTSIARLNFRDVARVDVDADNPCDVVGNLVEAVAACAAKNCDGLWRKPFDGVSEQVGQHLRLLDARQSHVAFVVSQR